MLNLSISRLVRIIVAKAQSQQMLQMLVSKLGGLLNRRVYHMPFSRNLRLTVADDSNVRKMYEDSVENRGVLLIQPEHILSFKLMVIESVLTDQPELARSMLATQEYFVRANLHHGRSRAHRLCLRKMVDHPTNLGVDPTVRLPGPRTLAGSH